MQLIERHIRQVQDEADEAWKEQGSILDEGKKRRAQELVFVCGLLWEASKEACAIYPPTDRDSTRSIARMLRTAEHAIESVLQVARIYTSYGEDLRGVGRLTDALREAQGMILMPTARQMAERDDQHRTAAQIRDALLHRVKFHQGRPVITPDVAMDFPCPLAPEPEPA